MAVVAQLGSSQVSSQLVGKEYLLYTDTSTKKDPTKEVQQQEESWFDLKDWRTTSIILYRPVPIAMKPDDARANDRTHCSVPTPPIDHNTTAVPAVYRLDQHKT